MANEFLYGESVWSRISKESKKYKKPAFVAVAYLGQGASKLLPLAKGSVLVVDASDTAVASGQTNPSELKKFLNRGVRVFSCPALHAKVYVFGGLALVGSANVSQNSAKRLNEALLATRSRDVVADAKTFIRNNCTDELGPERLSELEKKYRPPRHAFGLRADGKTSKSKQLSRLFVEHLIKMKDYPKESADAYKTGLKVAKSLRKSGRQFILDDFHYNIAKFRKNDKVIQIVREDDGRELVDVPGTVINVKQWSNGRARGAFVFLELENRRRIGLDTLSKKLGYGAKKKLLRNGLVRDQGFAAQLLNYFNAV